MKLILSTLRINGYPRLGKDYHIMDVMIADYNTIDPTIYFERLFKFKMLTFHFIN